MRTLHKTTLKACAAGLAILALLTPNKVSAQLMQPSGMAGPGAMSPAMMGNPAAMSPAAMGPMAPGGVSNAHYQPPYSMAGGYMDAHGDPIVNQTGFGGPQCGASCGPMGCGPMGCGPMGCGPGGCGPAGCGNGGCGLFDGSGCGMFGGMAGVSGMGSPQAGPHYFDFSAEYLSYQREDSPIADNQVISTFGFANDPNNIPPNQLALMGSDLNGNDSSDGYRLTGRIDLGALSVFEASYSGLYTGDEAATVFARGPTSNDTLYSFFSEFGSTTGGVITGPEFEETDNADVHRVGYETELHTAEATYRRYWVGHHPRVSGTLLVGFRYTNLQETLGFFSSSSAGSIDIDLESDNRLAGVQAGGDAWITVIPGLRVGGEAKVGIYNNDYDVSTSSVASDGDPNQVLSQSDNQVAFLTEAKLSMVANLTSSLSARLGYEVLYISDLALVGDNLTANPPYSTTTAPITANGDATWHGWHAGMEFTW